MPYTTGFRPAELFTRHKSVSVFHIYKDNDFDQGPRTYWFATHEDGVDENPHGIDGVFCVNCLPEPPNSPILSDQPPFIGIDAGRAAGFETHDAFKASPEYAHRKALWETWHQTGEQEAIRNTIRHAIDLGIVTPHGVTNRELD